MQSAINSVLESEQISQEPDSVQRRKLINKAWTALHWRKRAEQKCSDVSKAVQIDELAETVAISSREEAEVR